MKKLLTNTSYVMLLTSCLVSGQLSAVIEQETDVAIVGAGLSGLTTALRLETAGVDCSVYEAKDRPGGRTYSVQGNDGTVYNMGGEWIDKEHKAIRKLAKSLGVELQKETFDVPMHLAFPEGIMTEEEKLAFLTSIVEKLTPVVEFLRANKGELTVPGTPSFKSLAEVLPEDLTDDEREFIGIYIECDEGSSIEIVDSNQIFELLEDMGDFQGLFAQATTWWKFDFIMNMMEYQHRVVGGMSAMIDAAVDSLHEGCVQLQHILERVTRDATGRYHLFFNDGGEGVEVISNAVVMTIPFSVLRSITLDESIGLDPIVLEGIHGLQYGMNAKIHVPFAAGNQPEDYRYLVDAETRTIMWNPVSGKTGTTIFMGGEQGATLDEASAAPIVAQALPRLGVEQGGDLIIKNWAQDPYALGSYASSTTTAPVTCSYQSLSYPGLMRYAEPTDLFVLAGEHTRVDSGYMNSAVESGDFAAAYILEQLQGVAGSSNG